MNFYTPLLTQLENERNSALVKKTKMVADIAALRAKESPHAGNLAENRVRAILGEALLADVDSDTQRIHAALQELDILNKSIAIIDGRISAEKAVASRLLCEAQKPEVTRLGKAFAKAFLELHAAQLAYHRHLDKIQDTGASIASLPHVFVSGLGDAKDLSGTFMFGMKDFMEAGYLSEMPKELR